MGVIIDYKCVFQCPYPVKQIIVISLVNGNNNFVWYVAYCKLSSSGDALMRVELE